MSKVWLDVTTMLGWQRSAVGVVRVETECAAYCLENIDHDIHFCRFDRLGSYHEVKPEDVRLALKRIQGKGDKDRNISIQPSSIKSESRLKNWVLKAIDLLPNNIQTPAFNFLRDRKNAVHSFILGLKTIKHACSLLLDPASEASPTLSNSSTPNKFSSERANAPFSKNDCYISLGLDWDQKDLSYLYAQKRVLGFKVILFCYDLIPVKFPHLCVGDVAASFARYFADVAWCADEILCISECSKNDLKSLLLDLGAPIPPLSVVKLGAQLPAVTKEKPHPEIAQLLEQKYLLFVSTIERRKNHETIYRAYTRLIDQGKKELPTLVFVGMPGWGVNDFLSDIQLDPRVRSNIKILNKVSDSDLVKLYKNALFTVYPSLYEGWGLPLVESLAAGTFCLASNAASLPEAGEKYVEYLDPWDVDAWSKRMLFYIDNKNELQSKENLIANEYEPQRWANTAASIINKALYWQKH